MYFSISVLFMGLFEHRSHFSVRAACQLPRASGLLGRRSNAGPAVGAAGPAVGAAGPAVGAAGPAVGAEGPARISNTEI